MDETSIKQDRDQYRTHGHDSKPLRGASEQDRIRLGVLLQRRRGELGYGARGQKRFARERGVNWKGIYDIEKATRDGFMVTTLDEYARAYGVTYDSLVAVGRGEADELTAAFQAAPLYDLAGESADERPGGTGQATARYTNKPLKGASEQDRSRLGELLQRRRGELGYGGNGLLRFARERGVNWHGVTEIEKATRDTFMISTLAELARAYGVTYDSLVAVGQGKADELERADADAAPEALSLVDDPSGERLQEASIEKARAKLGDIIDHVRYTGDPVLITRHGTPAALVTPLLGRSDYASIDAARQSPLLDGPREPGGAWDVIMDLLSMLDRYHAADKNLDADQEHGDRNPSDRSAAGA